MFTKTIFITLLLVSGASRLSDREVRVVKRDVTKNFREIGVNIRFNKDRRVRNLTKNMSLLANDELAFWDNWVKSNSITGPTYVVKPPTFIAPGYPSLHGVSKVCAPIDGISLSTSSSPIKDRRSYAYLNRTKELFSHELGHLFGAQHDTTLPETMMYPILYIPPRISTPLYFSLQSIDQIKNCLAEKGIIE